MIRVALCDDHELVRRGLSLLLAQSGDIEVAVEAANFGALHRQLQAIHCDVLVIDIEMPGRNGIEAISLLRKEMPSMPSLVLSSHPESVFAVRALRAGAAGYLNKAVAPGQLVAAVRQVAAGRKFISPEVSEALVAVVANESPERPHETLSEREFQVFRLIAEGRKLSLIAETLSLSPKTVSVYRSRVLQKLQLANNVEIAQYAIRHGLTGNLE
jgi:two-component system, NarL family, invasion response regulator UvrY